ncbi:hypothetical protein ACIBQ0_09585 [Nocardia nova]|uniref:hypothetical protein n=1 Tax=Nocardia nova TaxID=37330 RepID=UPI0037A0E91B
MTRATFVCLSKKFSIGDAVTNSLISAQVVGELLIGEILTGEKLTTQRGWRGSGFVGLMRANDHSRKENVVDPLTILSLIDVGSAIVVNVLNIAGDLFSYVAPYLPHL